VGSGGVSRAGAGLVMGVGCRPTTNQIRHRTNSASAPAANNQGKVCLICQRRVLEHVALKCSAFRLVHLPFHVGVCFFPVIHLFVDGGI
jgi:hypothetical protein